MIKRLPEYRPLDMKLSRMVIADPVIAAFYEAIYSNVSYRKADGRVVFTVDIAQVKEKFSKAEINSREKSLKHFIDSYNRYQAYMEFVAEFGKEAGRETN
jgi:hypothetical protein